MKSGVKASKVVLVLSVIFFIIRIVFNIFIGLLLCIKDTDADAKKTDAVQPDDEVSGDAVTDEKSKSSPKKKKSDLDVKNADEGAGAAGDDDGNEGEESSEGKDSTEDVDGDAEKETEVNLRFL